jgi:Pectate lyase superfamily protein
MSLSPVRRRMPGRRRLLVFLLALLTAAATMSVVSPARAATATSSRDPDFGPNVRIFDPSMPVAQIQATVDAIAAQQIPNQFGPQRYALLFKPGTYGTAEHPLNFQVGYYTQVAGLGLSPSDVVINGSVYVRNQCDANNFCTALNNFWRSLENLTINVTTPDFGCYSGEFWAVSQAAPMRRVHVQGQTTLMDYCTQPSYASGGFIADSVFDQQVINGSQQQFFVRNSTLNGWSNGVWNQVFSGVQGAPAECFPAATTCGGPYTVVAATPVIREKPFLYVDAAGRYRVFVPALRRDAVGPSWTSGIPAGRSIPLSDFVVLHPGDDLGKLSDELARGRNLLFTPGTYDVPRTLTVKRADAVVLGLGLATLTPTRGNVAMRVADVPGVDIAGLIFEAGPQNSPVLLQVGPRNAHKARAQDPTALHDVFFRIGGAAAGRATVSLEVNSDYTILDDIWAWRADHGNGVGWTVNTADTGVVVNGDHVTAYGLFVEHYQKAEVRWNGQDGTVIFFQNEMPYDPPSQEAWREAPGVKGWPAFLIPNFVRTFHGYGMGSYSFFNQGVDIYADRAFQVPTTLPPGSLHDLLTVFLDPSKGRGGILHVVNDTGGSSTIANPDVPVTVVDYP